MTKTCGTCGNCGHCKVEKRYYCELTGEYIVDFDDDCVNWKKVKEQTNELRNQKNR